MQLRTCYTLLLVLISCQLYAQEASIPVLQARRFLHLMNTGKFDSAYAMQSTDLKRQIDAQQLEVTWYNFIEAYDSLTQVEETTVTSKDSLIITETIIRFVKKGFKYRLTLNKQGQVDGLFFQNLTLPYSPPAYVNTLAFYEVKLPVPNPHIQAEGILSLPKERKRPPLIIILGGSGPTDKDGSVGPNKMYKDIAWALAARGFAVYRFDKRTVNPENRKVKLETMHDEYADDLKHIIKYFKKNQRVNPKRIFVMGHSQGGMMLPYFAKSCKGIYGFIGLAAPFHTIADLLPAQLEYLQQFHADDSIAINQIAQLRQKAIYQQQHLYHKNINHDSLFPGLSIQFMQHMDMNKPAHLLSYLQHKPLLLLQGARDYQVPVQELEAWQTALRKTSPVHTHVFEKLNHQFMEGQGKPGPAEYNIPANVPEYVIDELVKWLEMQPD